MTRYIIVNHMTGVYAGIYYDLPHALKKADTLREKWPGLKWVVEESECGFPVPGLIHIGEVRSGGILKRRMSEADA